MYRYFIDLSFKGTNYHGWQVQPNAISVQSVVNNALSVFLKESITTVGSGRTDTGVHASHFIAHFDIMNELHENVNDLIYKINAYLPVDITIHQIFSVKSGIHARFSAISRIYSYTINQVKDPFDIDFSLYFPVKVNIELMNRAAAMLKGQHDFTSFSKLHSNTKTNICNVFYAEWRKDNNKLIFTIEADRFLRNMVRAITGTILDVGRGKTSMEKFIQILQGKDRNLAGVSVPPHALCLNFIKYPEGIRP